ncbi:MAG: hypothetical protein Kow0096_05680 [Thiohalomonadaceae bacterium]
MQRLSFPITTALSSLLLALIFVLIGVLFWQHDRHELDRTLAQESNSVRTAFEVALSDLEQQMLTLATMVASDPQVQSLFYRGKQALAREGGGPGGPQTARLRDELYNHVAPAWIHMQQAFGLRQLHFQFGPGSLSYLRVHTPEKFGDRMDGLRHIIEDVNADQRPRTGFETGRIYSGVRGVVPVWHNSNGQREYIGALEAGTSFDTQLARLDQQLGAGFAILLKQQHIEEAVWDQYRPLNGPRAEKGCGCYLEASSRDEVKSWMNEAILPRLTDGGTLSEWLSWQGKTWHLTRFPLRDYLGKVDPARASVGSVLVWRDKTDALAAWHRHQTYTQLALAAAYLLTQGLLFLLLRTTRRRLQERIDDATAALQATRQQLDTLLSASPAVTYSVPIGSTAPSYISPNVQNILGYATETIHGNAAWWPDHIHPDDRARVLQESDWQQWTDDRIIRRYRFRHADGGWHWLADRCRVRRDKQGKAVELIGSFVDISDRVAAEQRLEMALSGADLGLWDWHIPNDHVTFNARWAAMLGYRPDEIGPDISTWKRLIHPDDMTAIDEALQRHFRGETPLYETEHRLRHKDGHWVWVLDRGKVMERAEDGSPLRAVGTHLDITERKLAEERLRASETMLQRAQAVSHVGSWVMDVPSHRLEWSAETYRIFGLPPDTPADYNLFLSFIHPDDRDHVHAAWQAALQGAPYEIEHRIVVNGEIRWVREMAELITDANGELVSALGTVQDISDIKALELELRHLATTDLLTGLPNRRHFLERVEQELARFHRFNKPVALLMLDIDHFKQINDHYGHAIGDAVLQHFAAVARATLRKIDIIGRLGGEEFAVLLPGTELEGAQLYAERLRQAMENQPCRSAPHEIGFTISIGLTLFDSNDSDADLPLARADAALYRAKRNGRNRVEID